MLQSNLSRANHKTQVVRAGPGHREKAVVRGDSPWLASPLVARLSAAVLAPALAAAHAVDLAPAVLQQGGGARLLYALPLHLGGGEEGGGGGVDSTPWRVRVRNEYTTWAVNTRAL